MEHFANLSRIGAAGLKHAGKACRDGTAVIVGRRRDLPGGDPAILSDTDDVREGSPDVDADPHPSAPLLLFREPVQYFEIPNPVRQGQSAYSAAEFANHRRDAGAVVQ